VIFRFYFSYLANSHSFFAQELDDTSCKEVGGLGGSS
jgi:hypothetical protein